MLVELVRELVLVLVLVLELGLVLVVVLGLAAMRAASEAVAVVWDDDGEADDELDPEGEPDVEADPAAEPDGEGDAGVSLGLFVELVVAAGEVGELEGEEEVGELEGEEEEGEGEGVGVGDFDGFGVGVLVGVGVGVGEDVLEAGSTWQLVSVFALALVEVPSLDEAAASLSAPACAVACAVPGKPASTPRVRKPTLSAATRMCAKHMRSPCLRCSSGLLSALRGFGGN